jgi:hypothetical protein
MSLRLALEKVSGMRIPEYSTFHSRSFIETLLFTAFGVAIPSTYFTCSGQALPALFAGGWTFARTGCGANFGAETGAQTNALWGTSVAMGHVWQRRFYDFVVFTEKKR